MPEECLTVKVCSARIRVLIVILIAYAMSHDITNLCVLSGEDCSNMFHVLLCVFVALCPTIVNTPTKGPTSQDIVLRLVM